jgi:predicted small integral membrane protein
MGISSTNQAHTITCSFRPGIDKFSNSIYLDLERFTSVTLLNSNKANICVIFGDLLDFWFLGFLVIPENWYPMSRNWDRPTNDSK